MYVYTYSSELKHLIHLICFIAMQLRLINLVHSMLYLIVIPSIITYRDIPIEQTPKLYHFLKYNCYYYLSVKGTLQNMLLKKSKTL